MSDAPAIAKLEPTLVWTRFLELTRIARPPKLLGERLPDVQMLLPAALRTARRPLAPSPS